MNMQWRTQPITIEMIILTFPLYTQVLFTVTLIYISFLSHCQEMRRKERGSQIFFITSSSSFISSNQLEGFSISGNNLLSRWNGSWLNEFISVGQNPFVTVTITSSSVLVRLVMISHWTSPRLARSVGNTIQAH